jgi:hypothetical protein
VDSGEDHKTRKNDKSKAKSDNKNSKRTDTELPPELLAAMGGGKKKKKKKSTKNDAAPAPPRKMVERDPTLDGLPVLPNGPYMVYEDEIPALDAAASATAASQVSAAEPPAPPMTLSFFNEGIAVGEIDGNAKEEQDMEMEVSPHPLFFSSSSFHSALHHRLLQNQLLHTLTLHPSWHLSFLGA